METNGKYAVPLLGMREFTCKLGHTYKAPQPWRFAIPLSQNQVANSGPMCPLCFLDAMAFQFPSWPVEMTIEQAVLDGIIDHRALEVD